MFFKDDSSTFCQQKINADKKWKNSLVEEVCDTALAVKRCVNQKATEKNSWLSKVILNCRNNQFELLKHLQPTPGREIYDSELCEILQVGSVTLNKRPDASLEWDIEIKNIENSICPRCRRHVVLHEHDLCERCQRVLELQK